MVTILSNIPDPRPSIITTSGTLGSQTLRSPVARDGETGETRAGTGMRETLQSCVTKHICMFAADLHP